MNMRTKIIAIGILAMVTVCVTLATAIDVKDIEMAPDTLNLNSNGKYITVFINESDFDGIGIDPMELYLTDDLENNGTETNNVSAEKVCEDNEVYDYAVKFPRSTIQVWLAGEEGNVINLYVKYVNDTNDLLFIGTDIFNVTKSNKP